MIRATLQQVIEWLRQIDAWHNYALDDRQLQTIAPEFQDFGMPVLNEVLNQVKGMQKKPSPAQLMSMAKEVQYRFAQEKQIEAQINTNRKKHSSPPSAMDHKRNTPSSMPNGWVRNSEAMARRARHAGRQTATVVDFAHSSQRAST